MSETLAYKLYISIRDDIIEGKFSANEFLIEQAFVEKYGVSKAPVREALHRLCNEGYLKSYPRKGYMVNNISESECLLIQQFRFYIESTAVKWIVKNATDKQIKSLYAIVEPQKDNVPKEKNPYKAINTTFHLSMVKLVNNHYFYDTLYNYVSSITRVVIQFPGLAKAQKLEDHRLIIDALLERDEEKAIKILYDDLSSLFPFEI